MSSHDAYDPDLPEPTRIRGKERVTANLYELVRRGEPRAPAPRAPRLEPASTPPPGGSSRALGWIVGAVLLLVLGGALGYVALLVAR